MNFTNHTTKAIVLSVVSDNEFAALARSGVIVFCGWGARTTVDMVTNQIAYSRAYRPELKDVSSVKLIGGVVASGEVFVREESFGEADFIDSFLEKLRLRSEFSEHARRWTEVEIIARDVQSEAGYLGTIEFFPRLHKFSPGLRREVHETYLDAWIDYASERYSPIYSYEIPRLRLNIFRASRPTQPDSQALASILLSPEFFQRFILHFLSEKELYRLLALPPQRLLLLRNGDWRVFCEHYHTYLQACSRVLWRIQMLHGAGAFESMEEIFGQIIAETMRELPASIDPALFADFLSQVVGYCITIPGLSLVTRALLRPLAEFLHRRAKSAISRLRSRSFYPFIAKVRTAIA